MKSVLALLAASVFLALALARGAGAYVLEEDGQGHPLYWRNMPVRYLLVAGNVPGGGAGEEAVHRAFRTWTSASANVRYEFGGYASEATQRYDGKNVVYWVRQGWPFDGRLAAVTFHYYDTSDGHLLDADIIFNGERYPWTVDGTGYDIENSATHEVGHFGGLGHSAEPEATMFASTKTGETAKRSLHADDVAGLDALYGGTRDGSNTGIAGTAGDARGVSGGGGGGCAVGTAPAAGRPGELVLVALLLAPLLRRRARICGRPS